MREDFLHFVWLRQHLEGDLYTGAGQLVRIFAPGLENTDSGPDFLQARLQIGDMTWNGSVELHLKSSDWRRHGHQNDAAYNNVVLHVVWEHDEEGYRQDGTQLPVLAIRDHVPAWLLQRYEHFFKPTSAILCAGRVQEVPAVQKTSMFDKALMERLEVRAGACREVLQQCRMDWEEAAYRWLLRYFGFKMNNEPFEQLGRSLPLKCLRKHRHQQFQVEALLFGQAGLIPEHPPDDYAAQLGKEYRFLRHKYNLTPVSGGRSAWKFLRTRPANFPTLRLAQLAALLVRRPHIFTFFKEAESLKQVSEGLRAELSDYWQRHYDFGKEANRPTGRLGQQAVHSLVINVVVPLLVAYGKEKDENAYIDQAIGWLEQLPPEQNKYMRMWQQAGFPLENAMDTQAGLTLYHHYCREKHCLSCRIGATLMQN